jgi:hypothetical protein
VTSQDGPGVLSELTREYYASNAARYELRAQLCTDIDAMPIEDPSIPWDEQVSPYRPVATIEIPAQDSFSPDRRVYAGRVMSCARGTASSPTAPSARSTAFAATCTPSSGLGATAPTPPPNTIPPA